MYKSLKILLIFPLLLLLSFCAIEKKAKLTPQQLAEYQTQIQEADKLVQKYNYISLKQAFHAYRPLLAVPDLLPQTAPRFMKTALLLELRRKELGILDQGFLSEVGPLLERMPSFSGYKKYLEIVEHIPLNSKGIIGESDDKEEDLDAYFEWVKKNVEPLHDYLYKSSKSSDFLAYLYLSFRSAYAYKFKNIIDLTQFSSLFPDSPLLQYMLATQPPVDSNALKNLLEIDPQFYEANLMLGDMSFQLGNVLTAENYYLKVYEHIPESTILMINLSKVYFHSEEFEQSMEYNDKALALAPQYRDALLGKAMCLGYMGKFEEALVPLKILMDLGKYYIGETHYWTAWNQNELERIAEARNNIEQAEHYLYGHYEVSSLAGVIAYKQGLLKDAENHLKEALRLNKDDCESYYYLGKIFADWKDWKTSGLHYAQAAVCHEKTEIALRLKIEEIENSPMSQARKDKLILRKKTQIVQTRQTKATCQYNAAAVYFNSGELNKALSQAQKAAQHPTFKEKAEELANSINAKMKEKH